MDGIEKITGHIRSDAEAAAEEIIQRAHRQADETLGNYNEKADEIRGRYSREADREAEGIVNRASSSGGNIRRNMVLKAKADLIDQAFQNAEEYFNRLGENEKADEMSSLLASVIKNNAENEKKLTDEYDDEFEPADHYRVRFAEGESDAVCDRIIARTLDKIGSYLSENGKTLEKDTEKADIGGGFILVCGDTEINCSTAQMVYSLRPELEKSVFGALFG